MVHGIVLRNICQEDIPKILAIQRKSYPEVASGQLYAPLFLENHISIFYEAQFCVELNGDIIASATSLRVSLDPEHIEHTWYDIISQFGSPSSSLPTQGDSLYADDIVTHPHFRHLGIGTLLFDARKRIAKEYVERVKVGKIYDPVLTFQIKNGFKVIKVLPNYLYDPSSLHYATFIEWINLTYRK